MTTVLAVWPIVAFLLALWCGRVVRVCDRVVYPEMVVLERDYELEMAA